MRDVNARRRVEALFKTYYNAVVGVAWCACRNKDDAMEVAQGVFLDGYVHLLVCPEADVTADWLFRKALSRGRTMPRTNARRHNREEAFGSQRARESMRATEFQLEVLDLLEAIKSLQPELQAFIKAHYLDEVSITDIAQREKVNKSTISRRHGTALQSLRRWFGRNGVHDEATEKKHGSEDSGDANTFKAGG
jgi:RNA polymerase sigma factor (sigma-70 family)